MERILRAFPPSGPNSPMIYRLEKGSTLPQEFCLFHEHTDHYSLQVARAMGLEEVNRRLTEYLCSLERPRSVGEFLAWCKDRKDDD